MPFMNPIKTDAEGYSHIMVRSATKDIDKRIRGLEERGWELEWIHHSHREDIKGRFKNLPINASIARMRKKTEVPNGKNKTVQQ